MEKRVRKMGKGCDKNRWKRLRSPLARSNEWKNSANNGGRRTYPKGKRVVLYVHIYISSMYILKPEIKFSFLFKASPSPWSPLVRTLRKNWASAKWGREKHKSELEWIWILGGHVFHTWKLNFSSNPKKQNNGIGNFSFDETLKISLLFQVQEHDKSLYRILC